MGVARAAAHAGRPHGSFDAKAALNRQLRWLIGIRLLVIASVLIPYSLLQLYSGSTPVSELKPLAGPPAPAVVALSEHVRSNPDFVYLLGGLTSLATLFYIVLYRTLRERPERQAYVQFFGDLLLITGLVYYFGGISSPFSMLYLIVIAVASTFLRRRAGLTVASVAYLLYAALLLGLYFRWLPPSELPGGESASIWRLAYNLAVHRFGFYAVAMLTSYLS